MNYLNFIIEDAAKDNSKFNDNFWKWFGNSKVVDEQGNPLVVYHGGPKFNIFDSKKTFDGVFYFSPNKKMAQDYANEVYRENGGEVKAVYLSIQNPTSTIPASKKQAQEFKKQGYDGVIYKGRNGEDIFAAFYSNQIKSVKNNGEWNPNSNNIMEEIEKIKKDNNQKSNFDNSKVIDKQGNPLIVYHGTNSNFDNFQSDFINSRKHKEQFLGFWFTSDKSDAEQYGKNVLECYIDIQNPITENNAPKYARAFNKKFKLGYEPYECGLNLLETKHGKMFQEFLINLGVDGIIFDNNYIVFEPSQIQILKKGITE